MNLSNDIKITPFRKNANCVYFTYKGEPLCINKHKCILHYTELSNGKRWFQFSSTMFNLDSAKEEQIVSYLLEQIKIMRDAK